MPGLDASLITVFDGLLQGARRGARQQYLAASSQPAMMNAASVLCQGDISQFYFALQYPFEQLIEGLVAVELAAKDPDRLLFLVQHSPFIETQFAHIIVAHEGAACSADKTQTLLAALFHFFTTNEPATFAYEGQYTYHLPAKVFTEHEEILHFFDAAMALFYGKPSPDITVLQRYAVPREADHAA